MLILSKTLTTLTNAYREEINNINHVEQVEQAEFNGEWFGGAVVHNASIPHFHNSTISK